MNDRAIVAQDTQALTPMQEISREVVMIPGVDEEHRFQMRKLGNIHLGVKVKKENSTVEYPKATDYFVLPDDLRNDPDFREKLESMGQDPDKPKKLPVMLMSDYPAVNMITSCDCYGANQRLKCRSYDGVTCMKLNEKTFQYDTMPCAQADCQLYQKGDCAWYNRLRFLVPDAAGLGYWQVATKSKNNRGALIREMIDLRKALRGRIAGADLVLVLTNERMFNVPVTDRQGNTRMVATNPPLLHIDLGKSLRKLQQEVINYRVIDASEIEESYDYDEPTVDDSEFVVGHDEPLPDEPQHVEAEIVEDVETIGTMTASQLRGKALSMEGEVFGKMTKSRDSYCKAMLGEAKQLSDMDESTLQLWIEKMEVKKNQQ
jgi:hypothetical protein